MWGPRKDWAVKLGRDRVRCRRGGRSGEASVEVIGIWMTSYLGCHAIDPYVSSLRPALAVLQNKKGLNFL